MSRPWESESYVALDLETSGAYPIGFEICEFAAIKYQGGRIVDRLESLVKTKRKMSDEVIRIHGITNEMVATAPSIEDLILPISRFLQDSVAIAHHAPFDLGFLAYEFERAGLKLPQKPALCSSLLSRRLFSEPENHRLQTLIEFFKLPQGTAHRAGDDAEACLQVALRCFAKLGDVDLAEITRQQGVELWWSRFSISELRNSDLYNPVVEAIENESEIEFVYQSGSKPGQPRKAKPGGLVRSLDGDFFVATEAGSDSHRKRFYLNKLASSRRII